MIKRMIRIIISLYFALVCFTMVTKANNQNVAIDEFTNIEIGFVVKDGKLYYYDDNGILLTGLYKVGTNYFFAEPDGSTKLCDGLMTIDGKRYCFNSGYMEKGFVNLNGKLYHYDDNGVLQTGLYKVGTNYFYAEQEGDTNICNGLMLINGKKHYFNNGYMEKGFVEIENKLYYFDEKGNLEIGLYKVGTNYFYAEEDGSTRLCDGEMMIDGNRYYFNKGYMERGFVNRGNSLYYYNGQGILQTGLYKVGTNYFYSSKNGVTRICDGTMLIDGNYYFFTSGYMEHGFVNLEGRLYYYGEDGILKKGLYKVGTDYFFADDNGVTNLCDGVMLIEGKKYLFNLGYMERGFVSRAGKLYYCDEHGYLQTGLYTVSDNYFYAEEDGSTRLCDGELKINDKNYYFVSGYMEKGFVALNGNIYHYSDQGVKTFGWLDLNQERYYFKESNGAMVTGYQTINRRNYYFNPSNGKLMRMTAPVPYYMQTDPRWKDKKYGGNTMKSSGCAQTCAAMIFSFLRNETILPTDVANWGYKNNYFNGIMDGERFGGTIGSFWPAVAKHYGFTARGNLTVDQAIDDLRHGKLMIAGMNPPNFTFYGSTHAIVIYGIDENNYVSVYDPYFKEHNKKYPISQIFKEKSTDPDDRMSGGPIFTIG